MSSLAPPLSGAARQLSPLASLRGEPSQTGTLGEKFTPSRSDTILFLYVFLFFLHSSQGQKRWTKAIIPAETRMATTKVNSSWKAWSAARLLWS